MAHRGEAGAARSPLSRVLGPLLLEANVLLAVLLLLSRRPAHTGRWGEAQDLRSDLKAAQ